LCLQIEERRALQRERENTNPKKRNNKYNDVVLFSHRVLLFVVVGALLRDGIIIIEKQRRNE